LEDPTDRGDLEDQGASVAAGIEADPEFRESENAKMKNCFITKFEIYFLPSISFEIRT
jgi:hypothetical protein